MHANKPFYLGLNPQFTGLWRDVAIDASIPQGDGLPPLQVQAGDRIWASFKNAHLDVCCSHFFITGRNPLNFLFVQPKEFPNPTTIDPNRPKTSYNLNGSGFHNCAGVEYSVQTIAEILRVVFKLQNVRRAAGDAGKLSGFTEVVNETETNVFIKPNGTTSPWPGSMYLVVSRRRLYFVLKRGFLTCFVPVRPVILLRSLIPVALESVDSLPACRHLYIMLNHDLLWPSLVLYLLVGIFK